MLSIGSVDPAMFCDCNQHLSKELLEEEIQECLSVNRTVLIGDESRRGQSFEG